jgi:hypothetical protein
MSYLSTGALTERSGRGSDDSGSSGGSLSMVDTLPYYTEREREGERKRERTERDDG